MRLRRFPTSPCIVPPLSNQEGGAGLMSVPKVVGVNFSAATCVVNNLRAVEGWWTRSAVNVWLSCLGSYMKQQAILVRVTLV